MTLGTIFADNDIIPVERFKRKRKLLLCLFGQLNRHLGSWNFKRSDECMGARRVDHDGFIADYSVFTPFFQNHRNGTLPRCFLRIGRERQFFTVTGFNPDGILID